MAEQRPPQSGIDIPEWGKPLLVALLLGGLVLVGLAVYNSIARTQQEAAQASQTPTAGVSPSPFPTRTPLPTLAPPTRTLLPPNPTDTEAADQTETVEPTASRTATLAPTRTRTTAPRSGPTSPPPPTRTPVPPTATSTPAPPPSAHGITGQLTMCPKPVAPDGFRHYYAQTERVCFVELITNISSQTVTYGILGVQSEAISEGQTIFQTSWRGDLSICPGCQGPANGPWEDGLFLPSPGTYVLRLSICYSSVESCQGGTGEWETLTGGITIVGDPPP